MARVAELECIDCRARWSGPVGNVNYVVSRVCPGCGGKKMMAWGRAAKEDGCMEVKDVEVVEYTGEWSTGKVMAVLEGCMVVR